MKLSTKIESQMVSDKFNFTYQCQSCERLSDTNHLESFLCECGGSFKLVDGLKVDVLPTYWDETLKMHISSAQQRNREFRKAGLYVSQDDSKMIKRWSDQRKYKEDIHQELMAKEGIRYKPGSKEVWDEKHQDFTSDSKRRTVYFHN